MLGWGGDVIQVAAIVGAIATIVTLVLRPMWRFHLRVTKAVNNIDMIVRELGSNGGASLRDSVDRVEASIAFQDLRARALIQDAKHGYVETNGRGELTFANRTYLRWAGRSLDEVLVEGWVNILSADDRHRVITEWSKTVEHARDLTIGFAIASTSNVRTEVVAHCYKIQARPEGKVLGWACVIHAQL